MANKVMLLKSALLIGALLVQSCGGGEEQYAGIDRGGERPDLSVTGPINGFGSVIIDGVRYNTDDAEIFVRGVRADELQLEVGNYVTVLGRVNEAGVGIALEVHYQPKVTGVIEWLDPQRNRLSVLGQTIQLVQNTHYDSAIRPRNIEGLVEGQRISVSGIAASDSVIRASRVELAPSVEAEVAGRVSRIDPAEQIFYLNELQVEYGAISPLPVLREAQPVVVRGALEGTTFRAQVLRLDTDYRKLKDIPSLEFRGYVSQLRGEYFHIDGIPARLAATTVFEQGSAEDLTDSSQIRARGYFADGEILVVEHIEFISPPVMQSFGTIEELVAAPPGSDSLGTITVSGLQFRVRADTSLEGDLARISFADLRLGDSVYVSAFNEGKTLIASSLAIDNRDTHTMSYEFIGEVHALDYSVRQFSIYHLRIQTSADTFFSEMGIPLSEKEFYQSMVSKSVRVRGYFEDGILHATSAQISHNHFFDGYGASGLR